MMTWLRQHDQMQARLKIRQWMPVNRPKKSLRSTLLFIFVGFSIIPLAFLAGFSWFSFRDSINEELHKRLYGNSREFKRIISDLTSYLQSNSTIHARNASLKYFLSTKSTIQARRLVRNWLTSYAANRFNLFDGEGHLMVALTRSSDGEVSRDETLERSNIYLNDDILEKLLLKDQIILKDAEIKGHLDLVAYTKVLGKNRVAGYIEEIIKLDQATLMELSRRLGLEVLLLGKNGAVFASSHRDYLLFKKENFIGQLNETQNTFFDLARQGEIRRFIVTPLEKGNDEIFVGLGTSKKEINAVLKRITAVLFTVAGLLILFMVPFFNWISKKVLLPLDHLVDAVQRMEAGEMAQKIPVESQTEIGTLTESFNDMSERVFKAQSELKANVKELQSTQAQLVHSAKMVSLGQLVAGIAHELNNPIGFIYSNMSHLSDYGKKLIHLIGVAEKQPDKLEKEKKKAEFDYILTDMPKLIASCEEGARRTKDIVVGLRDFSRLDEAQEQEVNLNDNIQTTLGLLVGELKNRIKVNTDYGKIPKLKCRASQMNQVFMNILSNAAQAIKDTGEIWIKTWSEEASNKGGGKEAGPARGKSKAKIKKKGGGQKIFISIRDSGQGIPEKDLEHIFNPFFTTKTPGKGTGLGLSISYSVIEKHGGQITVSSEVGKGTEFVIEVGG